MKNLSIGNKIKSRRQELRLTQEQLAERSNSSVNFISELERGSRKNVTVNKLNDIAEGLNLSLSGLIDYKVTDKIKIESKVNSLPAMPNTVSLLSKLLAMKPEKAEHISKALLNLITSIKK